MNLCQVSIRSPTEKYYDGQGQYLEFRARTPQENLRTNLSYSDIDSNR